MQKKEKEFKIKSVEKAFALLDALLAAGEKGIPLSHLAKKTALPPATARNILRTMERSFHVMRTAEHLYFTGKAFAPFFRQDVFTGEEKLFLQENIKKLSILCGETICLFSKKANAGLFCISSASGSKGVVAGEEAAKNSIFDSSPAKELLLQKEKTTFFTEGKACKNALWSICLPFYTANGNSPAAVLAVFLPTNRAAKEKCTSIKEFLAGQKYCRFLADFFSGRE